MLKITGFDQLTKQLDDAKKAMEALDGELGTVKYDSEDPSSIESAISTAHALIDARVGEYASNPFVAPLIEQAKERFRAHIVESAAAARLAKDNGEP